MPGQLHGKIALVTGASRGLGRDIALALAQEGAAVAVAARTLRDATEALPGTVEETAALIEKASGRSLAVACDVSVEDDLVRLAETVAAELGPVDILVNNAALTVPGRPGNPIRPTGATATHPTGPSFLATPLKAYRKAFEVNLYSAYRLTQLVAPAMISRGGGSVVNISSHASRMPPPPPWDADATSGALAYGGSKAAMEHLTRAVALELRPYGVAVNALLPSRPIDTPGNRFFFSHLALEPSESFTRAALRLARADAATLTGEILYSDDVLTPDQPPRGWQG